MSHCLIDLAKARLCPPRLAPIRTYGARRLLQPCPLPLTAERVLQAEAAAGCCQTLCTASLMHARIASTLARSLVHTCTIPLTLAQPIHVGTVSHTHRTFAPTLALRERIFVSTFHWMATIRSTASFVHGRSQQMVVVYERRSYPASGSHDAFVTRLWCPHDAAEHLGEQGRQLDDSFCILFKSHSPIKLEMLAES